MEPKLSRFPPINGAKSLLLALQNKADTGLPPTADVRQAYDH
jgi:hypothetical protein